MDIDNHSAGSKLRNDLLNSQYESEDNLQCKPNSQTKLKFAQ